MRIWDITPGGDIVCVPPCTNRPDLDGFDCSTADGKTTESGMPPEGWVGHHVCNSCGTIGIYPGTEAAGGVL